MMTVPGLQSERIIAGFTGCYAYMGHLGIMTNEVVTMLEDETRNEVLLRRAQLKRILLLVDTASRSEVDKKKENRKDDDEVGQEKNLLKIMNLEIEIYKIK